MMLVDPLWDVLNDGVDYETYFRKEVWGERKTENEKLKEKGNNLIIIRYSDFYNLLFISLLNYLSRNNTNLLIETNLLCENEA